MPLTSLEVLVGTVIGAYVIALVIIYAAYRIESKTLSLIERGIIKKDTSNRNGLILLLGFISISSGAALMIGTQQQYRILTIGLLPFFIGIALIGFYIINEWQEKKLKSVKVNEPKK